MTDFKKELQDLLDKYDAKLSLREDKLAVDFTLPEGTAYIIL